MKEVKMNIKHGVKNKNKVEMIVNRYVQYVIYLYNFFLLLLQVLTQIILNIFNFFIFTLSQVRGSGLSINIGSATFRGPEEKTPRGGTGAQSISAGGAHSAIVLANGELYTWGAGK